MRGRCPIFGRSGSENATDLKVSSGHGIVVAAQSTVSGETAGSIMTPLDLRGLKTLSTTKSYYALNFAADLGGAYKNVCFFSSSFEEIQMALVQHLVEDLYTQVWHGQYVSLEATHIGEKQPQIDLLPHLQINIPDYGCLFFDAQGKPINYNPSWDDPTLPEEAQLWRKLIEHQIRGIEIDISWDDIAVPLLESELLNPGEYFWDSNWEMQLIQGWHDLDNGLYRSTEGFWIDYEEPE